MCNREGNDKRQRDRRQEVADNDDEEKEEEYANSGSKTRSSHYSKPKGRQAAGWKRLKRQTANKIAGEMAINTVGHGRSGQKGPLLATVDQLVGQNCQQATTTTKFA